MRRSRYRAKRLAQDSAAATIYVEWETALRRFLAEGHLDGSFAAEYLTREADVLVPSLTKPSEAWFGAQPANKRDALLESALVAAVGVLRPALGSDMGTWTWGRLHAATFTHALAPMGEAARMRFNVGPFPRAGYGDTVFSTSGPREILRVTSARAVRTVHASGTPGPDGASESRRW